MLHKRIHLQKLRPLQRVQREPSGRSNQLKLPETIFDKTFFQHPIPESNHTPNKLLKKQTKNLLENS